MIMKRKETEPKDARVITDKEYVNKLSKTERIQCISAPMGMGKTVALKKYIESLPQEARICILSTRITYSDAQHLDLLARGLEFTHFKGENSSKLYKHKRLIIQMESLYKIGAKNSASNKEGKYDCLILDAFSSLCRQFFSTTMDENRYLNVIVFERLIRNTPNIIVMDAFLSQRNITIIKEFRPNKE